MCISHSHLYIIKPGVQDNPQGEVTLSGGSSRNVPTHGYM